MPKLSDIARVRTRGTRVPDIENELAYNSYCLYEAVKAEMMRGGCENVARGKNAGLEGKVSVPTVLKFLWPGMSSLDDGADASSHQIRTLLYRYLRETKNLICISPGNRREMSTWWARLEWDDVTPDAAMTQRATAEEAVLLATAPQPPPPAAPPPLPAPPPPALPAPQPSQPSQPAGSRELCRHCSKPFFNSRQLTRHIYKEHEDLTGMMSRSRRLSCLATSRLSSATSAVLSCSGPGSP